MQERVLIWAPRGRDSEVIEQTLKRGSGCTEAYRGRAGLHALLTEELGALVLTEEALAGEDLQSLLAWIERQPPWSDLPVVLLASKQAAPRDRASAGILRSLGNVVVLERPINGETLLSAVSSALRGRRRQFHSRALLIDKEAAAAELLRLNKVLELHVQERTDQLLGAHETLAFALDAAEMGSWDLDLASDTSRRSLQHDRIFGYAGPAPEWGRKKFLQHVFEEDVPIAEAAFDKAEATGTLDLECRIVQIGGNVRWIIAKGRVDYDAERQPIRMAGIIMDVTQRRRTEEALRQSQKMEIIGQFTGGVAHDFNNLLSVVLGNLRLLAKRDALGEQGARLLRAAIQGAERGAMLTQRLLAFARRQDLSPEPISLHDLVEGMKPLLVQSLGEEVTLVCDVPDALPPVLADSNQLELAILNLALNAKDAMSAGGAVRVRAELDNKFDSKSRAFVRVSVSDDGCGMDNDTLARALEPFFTTKEIGKGTGLGISMVHGFAVQSGGSFELTSRVGDGTTASIILPASSAPVPSAAAEAPSAEVAQTSSWTVLLVDDDALVSMGTAAMLEDLGHKAVECGSAAEALELLQSGVTVDILVTDQSMPRMTGLELVRLVNQEWPSLPIIIASGHAELPTGHTDGLTVLNKPFTQEQLSASIDKAIQKLRSGDRHVAGSAKLSQSVL